MLLQILLPLRHYLYSGHVNWTEEGFRFAWRVMLIEKAGFLEYRVQMNERDRMLVHSPRKDLTRVQYKMLSTQPDMIVQYAHQIAEHYKDKGFSGLRVYARSSIWFNGHASQTYVDPNIDLLSIDTSTPRMEWIIPQNSLRQRKVEIDP